MDATTIEEKKKTQPSYFWIISALYIGLCASSATMPVRSLFRMAITCAHNNIDMIDNLSDMPYEMAQHILKKVTNPHQLVEIQTNSPHLAEHTGELWKGFIRRDLPNLSREDRMLEPKNPASWYKIYRRLMKSEKAREAAQEEELRRTLLAGKVQREEKKTMFVDKVLAHAREEPVVFVDGQRNKGRTPGPPSLAKAKTGTDALAAIRNRSYQNSKQIKMGRPWQANSVANNPTQLTRQIGQAPVSMMREVNQRGTLEIAPRALLPYQEAALREARKNNATIKIHAPGSVRAAKTHALHQKQNEAAVRQAREINEEKLRRLTQTSNQAARAKKRDTNFEFVPTVQAASPEPPKQASPVLSNTPAAATPPVASPPKQASPQPAATPVIIKKRPAPGGSIFMKPTKKLKR